MKGLDRVTRQKKADKIVSNKLIKIIEGECSELGENELMALSWTVNCRINLAFSRLVAKSFARADEENKVPL